MSNGTQAEPWIEELIQNYGTRQRTARVLARVLRVGEATGSLKELDEDPVALLLLSDGPAAIRGLLTREAWQKFLRGPHSPGAGETFSSLAGHSVLLLSYSLMAQREVEEGKWQLMLTVHELTTTFTPGVHKPRRSLQEGPSCDSEPCCSESPVTACQDRLSSLLLEVRGLLSPPRGPDCQGCPLTARTRWDRDRIRYKDGAAFSIPVSCCYISERQMEAMQRQAASLCVSVTCNSGELGEKGYPHSPDPENDSLLEFGNQEKVPINPWDRFAAEVGIRTPSEEGSGSVSPEGLPEIDDTPLCPPQPHHSQPDVVAMATGRQMSTWSNRPAPCEKQANEGLDSAGGSEQLRRPSNQSGHPPAEPASSSTASPSPVWTPLLANDVTLSLDLGPGRSNLRLHPRIRPPLPTPPVCELKTQQEEEVLLSESVNRSQRRKRPLLTVDEHVRFRDDEEDQEEGGLHEEEEPKILTGWDSCPSGPGTVRSLIKPRPKHAHPPASQDSPRRLSYTYDPKGCVAQAPRHLRIQLGQEQMNRDYRYSCADCFRSSRRCTGACWSAPYPHGVFSAFAVFLVGFVMTSCGGQ
nr:uncharacterized protein LOC111851960 isoform X2 [Paramormyrops kingsleyae]